MDVHFIYIHIVLIKPTYVKYHNDGIPIAAICIYCSIFAVFPPDIK